jgi:hypothetical protein
MKTPLRFAAFRAFACAALSAAVFLGGAAAQNAGGTPIRRFALVMGANNGGDGLARLRYAVSDARSFAAVLTELGGVADSDLVLLVEPGISAFRGAARRLEESAASATASGGRCEFLLYYSGHSDDEGLLLGRDRLGYAELRAAIEKVPAAVRVAILDSCSSGSLTRAKGGKASPAFLYDASSIMEGHAYITSSSADEAAQESDRIGGSFFTHYFVSALRGAADAHGEGKVTLNEAYAYSFRETLASTENTQYGPQHPGYEISLTGSGDLVVTDLRSSKAGLTLSEELSGPMYVRDAKGNLAVELDKAAGDRMELGLPPGKYSVAMIEGGARSQAEVLISAGGKATLSGADFKRVVADPADARGIEVRPAAPAAEPSAPAAGEVEASLAGFPISFGMTLMPDFSQGVYFSQEDRVVSLNILWGGARDVNGFQYATLLNADSGDLHGFEFAGLANAVKGRAGGVQFAPIANVAEGGFGGAQVLSLVNVSGGDARGAQVGLVNVASHLAGAQVGLVNISDRLDGAAIGLVNIERGGVASPQLWTENASSVRAGYALGTRIIYTIASIGFDLGTQPQSPSASLGMGGRLTVGPFFGDLDLSWREIFGGAGTLDFSRPQARLEARALAGFPGKGAGLIVGCALEAYVPGLSREDDGSQVAAFRVEPRILVGAKL